LAFLARKARDALTLEELLESWQSLHLATRRPRYAGEAVRALRCAFQDHLGLPAGELSRRAVIGALDAMALKKSASAGLLVAYGKALFNWALKRDVLASNPFVNLAVAPTRKRERVLSDEELAAIWRATDTVGAYNAVVRMLILTGQRREEVAGMPWSELSDDLATWTIPSQRTKNRRAHVVPLSQPARDLLHSVPRFNELVFPGLRGPFRNWWAAKINLDRHSGVTGWVLHDLRRTVATGLQRLGVRLEVTEAVLNHASGSRVGIVGIYQRHDWATEKRAALEAWGAHVLAIVEGREAAGNVVALRA
jgi:integrase